MRLADGLAQYFYGSTKLQHLDMSWNNMRGKGAVLILEGIKNNSTIETLDLSYNLMGSYQQGKDPAVFSSAGMLAENMSI